MIIVIAIIAILAGAIFVAVDPARRLHESRNSIRKNDVNTLVDAIKKYQADNAGNHYTEIDDLDANKYYMIGTNGVGCAKTCDNHDTITNCVDLEDIGSNYLPIVPLDPLIGTDLETGYYLKKDENNGITVYACETEGEGAGGTGTPPEIKAVR